MAQRQFTIDHFLSLQKPTTRVPLHLSPDGNLLAMSVQPERRETTGQSGHVPFTPEGVPQEMIGSRVLIVDVRTISTRWPFDGTSWGAQWSPDGQLLAAYVQHQGFACVGVWDRRSNQATLHSTAKVQTFFGFQVARWTPDNRGVVVQLVGSGHTVHTETATRETDHRRPPVDVFSFDPVHPPDVSLPSFVDWNRGDLAVVDVMTGAVRTLLCDTPFRGWQVAPDGRAVALMRVETSDPTLQQFYHDLIVVPFDSGQPQMVAPRVPQAYGICFSWSPDSRHLAYTTRERGRVGQAFVVLANGSEAPRALSDATEDWGLSLDYEAPRWSANGQTLYCLARDGYAIFNVHNRTRQFVQPVDDRDLIGWIQRPTIPTLYMPEPNTLILMTRNKSTKDIGLARVTLSDGIVTILEEVAKQWHGGTFGVEAAAHNGILYMLLEAADHPPEVWCWDLAENAPQRLASLNPKLERVDLGTSVLINYRALDGERRQAALLLPINYQDGQEIPVVVGIYGGELGSNHLHSFGGGGGILHGQLLASRGIAMLYPDCPLLPRDPLRQLPGQVVPAVNRLVDLGITTWRRVGIAGHSYGGYCTLAIVAQCPQFRVAVASAGFYDLLSTFGAMRSDGTGIWQGWAETGQGRTGGTPWEQRTAYVENSPIWYLDRVQTPLLLTCGSEDLVPPAQAEAVFVGLRRLGKRVEFRQYRGEQHWPGMWTEPSIRDLAARILEWFEEHILA